HCATRGACIAAVCSKMAAQVASWRLAGSRLTRPRTWVPLPIPQFRRRHLSPAEGTCALRDAGCRGMQLEEVARMSMLTMAGSERSRLMWVQGGGWRDMVRRGAPAAQRLRRAEPAEELEWVGGVGGAFVPRAYADAWRAHVAALARAGWRIPLAFGQA